MGSIIFKTKDGRKLLAASPEPITHEDAKRIIDAKWGVGYFDRVVVQGNVVVAIDDETHIKLNDL